MLSKHCAAKFEKKTNIYYRYRKPNRKCNKKCYNCSWIMKIWKTRHQKYAHWVRTTYWWNRRATKQIFSDHTKVSSNKDPLTTWRNSRENQSKPSSLLWHRYWLRNTSWCLTRSNSYRQPTDKCKFRILRTRLKPVCLPATKKNSNGSTRRIVISRTKCKSWSIKTVSCSVCIDSLQKWIFHTHQQSRAAD